MMAGKWDWSRQILDVVHQGDSWISGGGHAGMRLKHTIQ